METMISQISNGVRLTTSWRNVKIRREDLQLGKSLNSRRRVGEPFAAELEMNEVAGGASDKNPIYGLIYRRTSPREQTTREQFAGSKSTSTSDSWKFTKGKPGVGREVMSRVLWAAILGLPGSSGAVTVEISSRIISTCKVAAVSAALGAWAGE